MACKAWIKLVKPLCQLTGPLHCDSSALCLLLPWSPHQDEAIWSCGWPGPGSLIGVYLPWQPHAVTLGCKESLVLTGQHYGVLSAMFWLPRTAAEQSIKDEKPAGRHSQRQLGEKISWTSLPLGPGTWAEPKNFSEGFFFFLVRTAVEEQSAE